MFSTQKIETHDHQAENYIPFLRLFLHLRCPTATVYSLATSNVEEKGRVANFLGQKSRLPFIQVLTKRTSFFCRVEAFEVGEKVSDSRLRKVEDATSFLFFGEHWKSNLGLLGLEANMLAIMLCCPPKCSLLYYRASHVYAQLRLQNHPKGPKH